MGDVNAGQHMLDDDDLHSDYDEEHSGSGAKKQKRTGGKGKGKKAASPADADAAGPSARRTQNRLAQREFRQRKLAYVKELEAKVEFLGTSTNDQLETLKFLVKGLMQENQQLRKVLSGVCGFVGAGAGGHYGSLGFLKGEDLDAWVEAPQSDTLERLYSAFKAKRDANAGGSGGGASSSGTSALHGLGGSGGGKSARTSPSRSPTVSTATTGTGSAPAPVPPVNTRKRSRDSNSRSSQPNTPVSSGPIYASGPAEFQLNHPFHQPAVAPSFYNPAPPAQQQQQHPQHQHGGPYGEQQPQQHQQQQALFPQTSHQSQNQSSQTQSQPPQQTQQPQLSYPPSSAKPPSASSFFFDVQDPAASLNNSFTNDFLNEWINTGLTPTIETSGQTEFAWGQQQPQPQSGQPLPPSAQQPSPANSNASLQQHVGSAPPQRAYGMGHPIHTDFMVHPDELAKKYNVSAVNVDYLVQSTPILQALHLISYHKRSKRADANYVLPLTLQPTVLQQTVPHDERIDGVILPSLRDALIREAPHLELTDVFQDLLDGLTVHSAEAPLDPINWEVHESFMRQYPSLAVPEMVLSANRWRRSRGEPDIIL